MFKAQRPSTETHVDGKRSKAEMAQDSSTCKTPTASFSTMISAKRASAPRHSFFLDLSPELRNRIYEEVLLHEDDEYVEINSGFRPPALLQVNRQIRSETHQMYYGQERFDAWVEDCDSSLVAQVQNLQREVDLAQAGRITNGQTLKVTIFLNGRCDWHNLKLWCRKVQQAEISNVLLCGPQDTAASAALAVAESHVGGSWDKCERALIMVRRALGDIDEAWFDGDEGTEDEDQDGDTSEL